MLHHSGESYSVAVSRAGKEGRDKLQKIIDDGRRSAQQTIETIENRIIVDRIASSKSVRMTFNDDGILGLNLFGDEIEYLKLHQHAADQIFEDVGVPKKFVNHIYDEAGGHLWGKQVVTDLVNEILSHRSQRNLIRQEGTDGPVKGFLSDRYRRLDSRPLLGSFIESCEELSLVPLQGVVTDTKVRLRAVLPEVFEPVANEVMIFGVEFGNSDYRDGGVSVNLWAMRVVCTNLMIGEQCLRQIHLGSRLPDNIQLSDYTYRKDAEATAAVIRDVTRQAIGPRKVNHIIASIEAAANSELTGKDPVRTALARTLDKGELDRVSMLFDGPDVVNLPPGNNTWRLSNAVSWFAQSKGVTPDRKIELEKIAGSFVAPEAKAREI